MEMASPKLKTPRMKKILAGLFTLLLSAATYADTFVFQPTLTWQQKQTDGDGNYVDAFDLDHHDAYRWGIDWKLPANHVITGARLTFKNIWDWQVENDKLYIRLLDDTPAGLTKFDDNDYDNVLSDYFYGQGVKLFEWSDPKGGNNGQDKVLLLTLNFTAAHLVSLTNFTTDPTSAGLAAFGITFDPDCHYFNDGIKLYIDTYCPPTRVPDEGMTGFLVGLGLLGLAFARRFAR